MISVDIKINGKLIRTITAQNISEQKSLKYGEGMQLYQVEDISMPVAHVFEDGPEKLAAIICEHYYYKKLYESRKC